MCVCVRVFVIEYGFYVGFDPYRVVERNGSVLRLQCSLPCEKSHTWDVGEALSSLHVDPQTLKVDVVKSELPRCPHCNRIARPNVRMLEDSAFNIATTRMQEHKLLMWKV